MTATDTLLVKSVISSVKGAHLASGGAPVQSEMLPLLDESLSPKGEMKEQLLDRREPGELYPEEKEQGWEIDTDFRRQRKEMSQVMIHADVSY